MTERLHFHFSLSCIGGGNGNPLQCSCLENPRDGGAWWAAIYGVTQSQTWLKWLSSSSRKYKRKCKHEHCILELRNTEEYINYYFFFHFKVKASEEEKWTRLSQAGRTYLIPLQYVFRNNYVVSPCQIWAAVHFYQTTFHLQKETNLDIASF